MSAEIHVLNPVHAKPQQAIPASQSAFEKRDRWGRTPLLRAILEGSLSDMRVLLEAGADPDATLEGRTAPCFRSGETALMLAAAEPEKLALLLEFGADPARGPDGGLMAWIARELADDDGEVPDYFDGLDASRSLLLRA